MPGPKPLAINLNDIERQGLELLVRRYTTGQQKVIRARIVLLASKGKNNREIANELEVSLDTARLWRQRWLDLQPIPLDDLSIEERLDDLQRPGVPPRLTANQICQIQQLACEKPEESGRPISQWTSREIAAEIMKRDIVDTISARHSARILKKNDIQPHLIRYWLTPAPDDQFDEKVDDINSLYQQAQNLAQKGEVVMSIDEMTGYKLSTQTPWIANGTWKSGTERV